MQNSDFHCSPFLFVNYNLKLTKEYNFLIIYFRRFCLLDGKVDRWMASQVDAAMMGELILFFTT